MLFRTDNQEYKNTWYARVVNGILNVHKFRRVLFYSIRIRGVRLIKYLELGYIGGVIGAKPRVTQQVLNNTKQMEFAIRWRKHASNHYNRKSWIRFITFRYFLPDEGFTLNNDPHAVKDVIGRRGSPAGHGRLTVSVLIGRRFESQRRQTSLFRGKRVEVPVVPEMVGAAAVRKNLKYRENNGREISEKRYINVAFIPFTPLSFKHSHVNTIKDESQICRNIHSFTMTRGHFQVFAIFF